MKQKEIAHLRKSLLNQLSIWTKDRQEALESTYILHPHQLLIPLKKIRIFFAPEFIWHKEWFEKNDILTTKSPKEVMRFLKMRHKTRD